MLTPTKIKLENYFVLLSVTYEAMFIYFVSATFIFTFTSALQFRENASIPELVSQTANSAGRPGGKNPVNLTNEQTLKEFKGYAARGLQQLEKRDGDPGNRYTVIRLKEATTQVVAGSAYDIVFYVGECDSNSTVSLLIVCFVSLTVRYIILGQFYNARKRQQWEWSTKRK